MKRSLKQIILILGGLTALLVLSQLVMGILIANGSDTGKLRKAHQHSGYLTATIAFLYVGFSMSAIASAKTQD